MPKKKVITAQARKMVYDVNGFIKKETNEIVSNLKLVKNATAGATITLQKNLETNIQILHQIKNRITSAPDKSILAEICNKLERIREESGEASKSTENKLQWTINNLKQCQKRTALATNTSVATVRNISSQADNSESSAVVFRTPGKKRPRVKPITDIDNFDQGVVRRCIHNFHQMNKELPTVEKLRRKLQEDIKFQGSEISLRRIIKGLGFRWKKIENNRRILIEMSNIRVQRIEYLKKIRKYRQEGRPIIFTDETFVDSSHSNPKSLSDGYSQGLKQPISKGQGVVIIHAGYEAGFVPNALLTFKADCKSGNYQDNINYDNYEKWIRTHLLPNIPPNSVVVLDNTPYHNKQCDLLPTSNSKIADMQAWLTEKGIEYETDMLKPELYKLIKTNKEKFKTFSIDKILAEKNHNILRLPPYHPDLNPIKMAWSTIKQYVESKNVKCNTNNVIELVKEKVNLMGPREWEVLCNTVKNIEEEYAKSDHVIDSVTEQFIIHISDGSSDSDDSQDEDDYEMSDEDEIPSRCEPSHRNLSNDDSMEGIIPLPLEVELRY